VCLWCMCEFVCVFEYVCVCVRFACVSCVYEWLCVWVCGVCVFVRVCECVCE